MGKPIPVPKVDKADKERFDATVEAVHAKVCCCQGVDSCGSARRAEVVAQHGPSALGNCFVSAEQRMLYGLQAGRPRLMPLEGVQYFVLIGRQQHC